MKRRDEGFVLVAMIWIVAVLTVVTLGFAHRALLDRRAAALSLGHSRAQYLARGAVAYAVADIQNKAFVDGLIEAARAQQPQSGGGRGGAGPVLRITNEGPDLLADAGVFTVGRGGEGDTVSYSTTDAEGRISVNTAPEALLDNIEGLGMRTVSAILRRRGTELSPEDREPFLAVEELRTIDDISEDDWEGDDDTPGLRDLFTVYGEGRINVNTASRAVLLAVPDLDEGIVDRIVGYRQGEDGKLGTDDDRQLRSLESMSLQLEIDPTDLSPLARYCTFDSHFLTITGFATQRQGAVRAAAQAVVQIQEGGATVVNWSEGEFGPQVAH